MRPPTAPEFLPRPRHPPNVRSPRAPRPRHPDPQLEQEGAQEPPQSQLACSVSHASLERKLEAIIIANADTHHSPAFFQSRTSLFEATKTSSPARLPVDSSFPLFFEAGSGGKSFMIAKSPECQRGNPHYDPAS